MDGSALAATAGAYSAFGGVLAGFAFTGLCVYLARQLTPRIKPVNDIEVKHVAGAIFYSMVSLGIVSFLYANLAGVAPSNPGAAETALLSYGIIFALAVLSLFYSVALMMLEHPLTRDMAKHAYWAVTIAGTVMVLRFLAGSARDALEARCGSICGASGILSSVGIWLTLLIAASLSVLITVEMLEHEPSGELGKLKKYPIAAPLVVFLAAVFVTTTGSLYVDTRGQSYEPSAWLVYVSYSASIFLVILFALACGRVVAPRAEVSVTSLLRSAAWIAVKLGLSRNSSPDSSPPDPSASVSSRPVKIALSLGAVVPAVSMLFIGGSQFYLTFFVLGPALIIVLPVYARCHRRNSRNAKEAPSPGFSQRSGG